MVNINFFYDLLWCYLLPISLGLREGTLSLVSCYSNDFSSLLSCPYFLLWTGFCLQSVQKDVILGKAGTLLLPRGAVS